MHQKQEQKQPIPSNFSDTTEMKIIRAIHGKTLRDKIRSDQLQQLSGTQDIVKWASVRRRDRDAHANRMEDNRLAKSPEIIVHRE
jgi:hypothetical protein